jgi:hypothetical protein
MAEVIEKYLLVCRQLAIVISFLHCEPYTPQTIERRDATARRPTLLALQLRWFDGRPSLT